MLIWGYETKEAKVSAPASDACPRCGVVTPHIVRVEWEIVHLYVYLRSVRWERWFAKCIVCGEKHQLSGKAIEAVRRQLKADPIPFWDRNGAGVVVIFVVVVVLALGALQ